MFITIRQCVLSLRNATCSMHTDIKRDYNKLFPSGDQQDASFSMYWKLYFSRFFEKWGVIQPLYSCIKFVTDMLIYVWNSARKFSFNTKIVQYFKWSSWDLSNSETFWYAFFWSKNYRRFEISGAVLVGIFMVKRVWKFKNGLKIRIQLEILVNLRVCKYFLGRFSSWFWIFSSF